MRLVHAVLLPCIIVFVSKVTLLQALALRGDVADHPVSGLRDTSSAVTSATEARSHGGLLDGGWGLFAEEMRTLQKLVHKQHLDPQNLPLPSYYDVIKVGLREHYNKAMAHWSENPVKAEKFEDGTEFAAFEEHLARINGIIPGHKKISISDQ